LFRLLPWPLFLVVALGRHEGMKDNRQMNSANNRFIDYVLVTVLKYTPSTATRNG